MTLDYVPSQFVYVTITIGVNCGIIGANGAFRGRAAPPEGIDADFG